MIVVERADGLVLVQDLGRGGVARLGVAPSGAFDLGAHLAANAAVGNAAGAATLEVLLGPLVLRARRPAFLAVTGAGGRVLVDDLALAPGRPFALLPGMRAVVEPGTDGVRRYVAVRGGFDVPDVLGSRSRDTLANLGPAPLAVGDVLAWGADAAPADRPTAGEGRGAGSATAVAAVATATAAEPDDDGGRGAVVVLEVLPGPRPELFAPGTYAGLGRAPFTVTDRCDRVAVRLAGHALARIDSRELPPEGVVAGAIQVPPSLQPVVLGPDHPLTGGYPVLGVLTRRALDRLAQVRPGDRVLLHPSEQGVDDARPRTPGATMAP